MSTAKILIIDDSRTILFHLERILTGAGYQVVSASDGGYAVELLKKHNPDLLILDINMPGLDGYGVCEKISKECDIETRPPVIFLTSVKSKALDLLGHEYGAYLHKSVCRKELLRTVRQQLDTERVS